MTMQYRRAPARLSVAVFMVAAATLIAHPARSQTLTFREAVDRATATAPSVDARQERTAGARRAAVASDQLPDPKLNLGFSDLRLAQAERVPPFPNTYVRQTIGIRQDIPNLKKRHARTARSSADIIAAEAGEAVAVRDVRVGAALAWMDLHYAERRLRILELLEDDIHDLSATIAARLTSGSANASQAFDPQILKAELADRRSDRIADIAKARAQLTRWTGAPAPEAVGPAPKPKVNEAALRAGVGALPILQERDAAIGQAEAEVRLARAQKNPDIGVDLSVARRQPQFGTFVSIGVSIDLPLFAKKRQNPVIDARLREEQAARLERQDAEREALAALSSDLADHRALQEKYERARETLVPLAKKRALVAKDSYIAGRTDLGFALNATVALADAEIDLLDREAALERDAVRIMFENMGDVQ